MRRGPRKPQHLRSGSTVIRLELVDDAVQDGVRRPGGVDDHNPLLRQRTLERLELVREQPGREEVVGPLPKAIPEHRGGHVEQEHADLTDGAEPFAMGPPKRAAREDQWISSPGSSGHAIDPGVPLSVAQGLPARHLLPAFGSVESVGVEERDLESRRQFLAEGGLPGARDADEHDDHALVCRFTDMGKGSR